MKIVVIPLTLCLATIIDAVYGRRGTIFVDQIFKANAELAITEALITTTITAPMSTTSSDKYSTVDDEIRSEKEMPSNGDVADPINVQVFYPSYPEGEQKTTTIITTTKRMPAITKAPSRWPVIQIFNYQLTPDTTTITTTTQAPKSTSREHSIFPFHLIPFIAYPNEPSTTTDTLMVTTPKPNLDAYSAYASLLGQFVPFLTLGPQTTRISEATTIITTPATATKFFCSYNSFGKAEGVDKDCDDLEDEDDEHGNAVNHHETNTIFHPMYQGHYNGIGGYNSYRGAYNQLRGPLSNNPFHYGSFPFYGNLPFGAAPPASQYGTLGCQMVQDYWECMRLQTTTKRPIRPRTRPKTITTSMTTKSTTSAQGQTKQQQQQYPYFQILPFLITQQQQQLLTMESTTTAARTSLPYQPPYNIHIIQFPPVPQTQFLPSLYGYGGATTKKTTNKTTTFSAITTTSTRAPGMNSHNSQNNSTSPSSSSSAATNESLIITILPSNMQCFAVNPECHSVMRTWTKMIPYSSVTRWTKRHWSMSTTPSAASNASGTVAYRTPKSRRTTTTEFYYDYSDLDAAIYFLRRCNITAFTSENRQLVSILFYCSSGWIIFWVLMTLIVNSIYKEFGAHRWLDVYQEFGFVVIYAFMGIFVLRPAKALCTATTMILLFFLVFNLCVAFMQTFWMSSIIKGSSERNGRLPILVNYIWPLIIATSVMLTSFFTQRVNYASTRVHCFCELFSPLHWTFTIAAWTLWFIALTRNQLAVTACRQCRPAVDTAQLYWAKFAFRLKATPILISWFLLTFFTLMFAVDLQLLWMCVVYTVLVIIFGPLLFYFHTQNHIRSNNGLAARTYLGLYRVCPPKRQMLITGLNDGRSSKGVPGEGGGGEAHSNFAGMLHRSHSIENPNPASHGNPSTPRPLSIAGHRRQSAPGSVSGEPSPAPTMAVPPVTFILPPPANSTPHPNMTAPATCGAPLAPTNNTNMLSQRMNDATSAPTSAQTFYDWLMDLNEGNIHESEHILFRPPGLV